MKVWIGSTIILFLTFRFLEIDFVWALDVDATLSDSGIFLDSEVGLFSFGIVLRFVSGWFTVFIGTFFIWRFFAGSNWLELSFSIFSIEGFEDLQTLKLKENEI